MTFVNLHNATLEYPLYDATNLSMRNSLIKVATGGHLRNESNTSYVRALDNVNISVSSGDKVALIGHNGAGKSTLLKVIAGVYKLTSGSISLEGSIASVFEIGAGLDFEVSGKQNILNYLLITGKSYSESIELIDQVAEFSELNDFLEIPIRAYSSGMVMRLMFSLATIDSTDILLLDEMFSTGDQDFQKKSLNRLQKLITDSNVFFFASHDLELLKRTCNRFFRLSNGVLCEVSKNDF